MDDMEDKKNKVVRLFKDGSNEKRRNPTISVRGNNNIAVGGDVSGSINVNVRRTIRHQFKPGPEHISSQQANKIRSIVKNIVDKETAGGGSVRSAYARWYGRLQDHFSVQTYAAIPRSLGEDAILWLQQEAAIRRPKLRRTNNSAWRRELYTAIWARAKNLGLSKGDVYSLVGDRLDAQVISLKQLGERKLKALYNIIKSM